MTTAGAPLAFAIIFSNLRNALTFFLAQPRRNGLDAEHGKPPVSSNPSDPGNGASAMPPPPEPAVGRLLPRSSWNGYRSPNAAPSACVTRC